MRRFKLFDKVLFTPEGETKKELGCILIMKKTIIKCLLYLMNKLGYEGKIRYITIDGTIEIKQVSKISHIKQIEFCILKGSKIIDLQRWQYDSIDMRNVILQNARDQYLNQITNTIKENLTDQIIEIYDPIKDTYEFTSFIWIPNNLNKTV